jgi:hypothetical protein
MSGEASAQRTVAIDDSLGASEQIGDLLAGGPTVLEAREDLGEVSGRRAFEKRQGRGPHPIQQAANAPQDLYDPAIRQAGCQQGDDLAIAGVVVEVKELERVGVDEPAAVVRVVQLVEGVTEAVNAVRTHTTYR